MEEKLFPMDNDGASTIYHESFFFYIVATAYSEQSGDSIRDYELRVWVKDLLKCV